MSRNATQLVIGSLGQNVNKFPLCSSLPIIINFGKRVVIILRAGRQKKA